LAILSPTLSGPNPPAPVPTSWCAGDFDYPSPPDAPLAWLGVDQTDAVTTLEALVDDARAAGFAIYGHGFASGEPQAAFHGLFRADTE
jgi:hypothetical protein